VHFEVPAGSEIPRPGDVVTVTITDAKPFFLIADDPTGAALRIRRTRAGDAWDRAEAASCGVPASGAKNLGSTNLGLSGKPVIGLGLPTVRVSTSPIYDPTDGQR
jgi:tRNA-2-methylthio-N6-dimethylallyladenosine synthase